MNIPFKILKIYILLLTSVLFIFSVQIIMACAGGEDIDITNYSVFAPEIIDQPKYSPFFFTYNETYPYDANYNPATSDDYNVNEWYEYFDKKVTKEDISWFVYASTPQQLQTIYISLWEKAKLPDTLQQKSLINVRLKDEMPEIMDYLSLSKKAEPVFNMNNWDWYQPIVYDSAAAASLQKEFLKGFIRSKNLFLKHRYGFQLMRAYFYANDFQKGINLMSLMPALNAKSGSIYYRCLGFKAAALYRLKRYKESNLIYAQLYDEYQPQQLSAYRSFHLLDDTAMNHNIELATTIKQKENLWQLYGIYANPLKALHHIYKLNPKSELLPLLLVRNINIIETLDLRYQQTVYANENSWSYYYYQPEPFIDSSLFLNNWEYDYSNKQKVLHILHQIITEKKVEAITPYLVSAAYLHALSNQFEEAIKLCNDAIKLSNNKLILNQAEIIKALVLAKKSIKIDAANELELAKQLNLIENDTPVASRAHNALNYVMYIVGKNYANQGDKIKSELCYANSSVYYKNSDDADKMIKFLEQQNHNEFEKLVINRYHLKLNDIYNIKGICLLYEYNFLEALKVFDKMNYEEPLPADPFTMRLVDCHDCDFAAYQDVKYTRKTFTLKLIELQKSFESEKNKETLAQNLFLYANALYNMTYFGNGRFIATTPISWMEDNYSSNFESKKNQPDNYYNCTVALEYYVKAKELTNNKDFAAQCNWGAAKCEHNLKLMDYLPWQTQAPVDFEAGTYFNEMKSKYAGTKYYKEALNECGYFCTFITKDTICIRDKWSLRNR